MKTVHPEPIPAPLQDKIDEAVSQSDLPLGGILSSSEELINMELSGSSYLQLPEDSKVVRQAYAIFESIFV